MALVDITSASITGITVTGAAAPYQVDVTVEAVVVKAAGELNFGVTAKLHKIIANNNYVQIGNEIQLNPSGAANTYSTTFNTNGLLIPTDAVFVQVNASADFRVTDRQPTLSKTV